MCIQIDKMHIKHDKTAVSNLNMLQIAAQSDGAKEPATNTSSIKNLPIDLAKESIPVASSTNNNGSPQKTKEITPAIIINGDNVKAEHIVKIEPTKFQLYSSNSKQDLLRGVPKITIKRKITKTDNNATVSRVMVINFVALC